MTEGRFNDSVYSAEEFILEYANKKTRKKNFLIFNRAPHTCLKIDARKAFGD